MREQPVVRHEWPIGIPVEGVAPGVCIDSAYVLTDHDDCDVCLMVDQFGDFGGRHALMRMTFFEAQDLADALVAACWPALKKTRAAPDDEPAPHIHEGARDTL